MEKLTSGTARRLLWAKRVTRVGSLASVACSLALGCSEEGRACTARGCSAALTLTAHVPSSVMALEVRVCEDDECVDFELDLPEFEAGADPRGCVAIGSGSTGYVCALGATGSARPIQAQVDVSRDTGIAHRMRVRDRSSGAVLLDRSGVPTFTEYYPNGKECDGGIPCLSGTLNFGE